MSKKPRIEPPPKTGWPPGMFQDDCRKVSKALAAMPHAKQHAKEAATAIAAARKG